MNDPRFIPEGDRQLLAVYDDSHTAARARTALLEAGVPPGQVHLDEDLDVVAGLRAEMLDEMSRAVVAPQVGIVYPRESARGIVIATSAALVGALLAFPLAAIDLGSSYPVRLAIWIAVLATAGLVIGLIAGAGLGAPRPGEEPAAAWGTTLRVERDDEELRRLLGRFHPITLDELDRDGGPIERIHAQGDDFGDTAADVAANVPSDDYTPQRGPQADDENGS
jgi:hypothetical protein